MHRGAFMNPGAQRVVSKPGPGVWGGPFFGQKHQVPQGVWAHGLWGARSLTKALQPKHYAHYSLDTKHHQGLNLKNHQSLKHWCMDDGIVGLW